MIVDLSSQVDVIKITLTSFVKLFIMSYLVFYKLPQYIFPQKHIKDNLDRIVYNVLYMITTVLIIVPLLLLIKLFSLFNLIVAFILLKSFFVYYFEKKNFFYEIMNKYNNLMVKLYDFLDYFYVFVRYGKRHKEYKQILYLKNISYTKLFKQILLTSIIISIVYNIGLINFVSLSNRSSDVPIFIEWVNMMQQNQLYSPNLTIKSFGGYFFGTPVLIFFLQTISNIDITILMSLYPILIILFFIITTYYFIYKITHSPYAAMIGICVLGFYCFSPIATNFSGYIAYSKNPIIVKFFNFFKVYFNFYNPNLGIAQYNFSSFPYERFNSGLAYEIVCSFYLLYIYFFIMTFLRKNNHSLLLYGMTLYCIFTISGAATIIFFLTSVIILLNALFFKKIDFQLAKKGFLVILIAGILGNLWALSMIKYGKFLKDFGAAAPFLDMLFKTERGKRIILSSGIEMTSFVSFVPFQLFTYSTLILFYPISLLFFKKRRKFIYSSVALSIITILFIYLEENFGLPKLIDQGRSIDYLLLVCAVGFSMYYKIILEFLFIKFFRHYYSYISILTVAVFFFISVFFVPSWNNSKKFLENTNSIQYNSLALGIYKIKKVRRPLTWTLVSFVEGYSKVLGKGFHLNVFSFLEKISPEKRFLEIPSNYVYIAVENIPNTYQGSGEWYYRWRRDLENELQAWIQIYSNTHDNIKVFYESGPVTIYEIDNREYIKYLYKRKVKSELSTN